MSRYEEMSRGALIREVEAIAEKIERLRAALGPIVHRLIDHDDMLSDERDTVKIFVPLGELRRARSALEETK